MRFSPSKFSFFAFLILLVTAGCNLGASSETSITTEAPSVPDQTSETPTNQPDNNTQATVEVGAAMTAAAPEQKTTGVTTNTQLKAEVEAAYTKLTTVLTAGDKQAFLDLVDPNHKSPVPTDDEWKQGLSFVRDSYPPLSKTTFISLEQKSPTRVYYFMLTDLTDPNYTSVSVITFEKIDGSWQTSGSVYSSGFPKNKDPQKEQAAIAKAVSELRIKADK